MTDELIKPDAPVLTPNPSTSQGATIDMLVKIAKQVVEEVNLLKTQMTEVKAILNFHLKK